MKAIILAAGKGNRLYPLTKEIPKALQKLNGETILGHQIQNLRGCGINEIVIVTGFQANKIKELGGPNILYIHNPIYETTNNLVSLWFARNEMDGDFIFLNGDVVFDRRILEELLRMHQDICFVTEQKTCIAEDMKVKVKDAMVVEINKSMDSSEAYGEFIGIAKFSQESSRALAEALAEIVKEGDLTLWFESAAQRLIDKGYNLYKCDTNGKPWIEIDFPEDLEMAQSQIYPAIPNMRYKRTG